jgi:xanthine dehydrogenase YagS FAD-binding subunit
MKSFAWIEPDDLTAALSAGAQPGALYKAGGVDVLDRLKEHLDEPRALVNLRRLSGLDFLRDDGSGGLKIGPLITLAALADDRRVKVNAPALADAAAAAATPQIRNLATLGGNIAQRPRCWYFRKEEFHCRRKGGSECFAIGGAGSPGVASRAAQQGGASGGQNELHAIFDNDLCAIVHPSATATALSALLAKLVLKGPEGERVLPIDEFFVSPKTDVLRETVLKPGELITEVRVPGGRRSGYVKLMEKQSFDWPLAEAAVSFRNEAGEMREVRVVLGAAAPVPWRAVAAEKMLEGRRLDETLAAEAAKAALEGAKPLQHNGYKLPLLEVAVRRALFVAGGAA